MIKFEIRAIGGSTKAYRRDKNKGIALCFTQAEVSDTNSILINLNYSEICVRPNANLYINEWIRIGMIQIEF